MLGDIKRTREKEKRRKQRKKKQRELSREKGKRESKEVKGRNPSELKKQMVISKSLYGPNLVPSLLFKAILDR